VAGRRTQLFCAWLAWSLFRVVIPTWDQTWARRLFPGACCLSGQGLSP
jgi:hypothetical protein